MKSPRDKYISDPEYKYLVDHLEHLIAQAHFTPSELREACILASINYEMRNIRRIELDPQLEEAFRTIDNFIYQKR